MLVLSNPPAAIMWTLEPFSRLRPEALYEVMRLRQRVFVVEQGCAYLDCDGHDERAQHLLGCDRDGSLCAYARLLGPGTKFEEASIGRVVVARAARGTGLGRALMSEAVSLARGRFSGPLRIAAQLHLERFYGSFGFVRSSAPFEENGVPHIHMLLP